MDGEPMLGATQVDIEVLPGSLRVLMPATARERLCKSLLPGD
jgi:diacylglycerol kinase family enzyme